LQLFKRIQKRNRENLKDLKGRIAHLFGRGKVAWAQREEFTRLFFEVFEVFAVQFSSWAKQLTFFSWLFGIGDWLSGLRKSFPGRWGRRQDRVLPVIAGNETCLRASVARHPLRRIGEPADAVSAMAWLADPRNGWITGQILGVDGGLGSVRSRH
jgi:hypothetical protein